MPQPLLFTPWLTEWANHSLAKVEGVIIWPVERSFSESHNTGFGEVMSKRLRDGFKTSPALWRRGSFLQAKRSKVPEAWKWICPEKRRNSLLSLKGSALQTVQLLDDQESWTRLSQSWRKPGDQLCTVVYHVKSAWILVNKTTLKKEDLWIAWMVESLRHPTPCFFLRIVEMRHPFF